jgi:hypothetical protein
MTIIIIGIGIIIVGLTLLRLFGELGRIEKILIDLEKEDDGTNNI